MDITVQVEVFSICTVFYYKISIRKEEKNETDTILL